MLGFKLMIRHHFSQWLEVPTVVKNGLKINKNKSLGARIQTRVQVPLFTMVDTCNHCETSFSKYHKKNTQKNY